MLSSTLVPFTLLVAAAAALPATGLPAVVIVPPPASPYRNTTSAMSKSTALPGTGNLPGTMPSPTSLGTAPTTMDSWPNSGTASTKPAALCTPPSSTYTGAKPPPACSEHPSAPGVSSPNGPEQTYTAPAPPTPSGVTTYLTTLVYTDYSTLATATATVTRNPFGDDPRLIGVGTCKPNSIYTRCQLGGWYFNGCCSVDPCGTPGMKWCNDYIPGTYVYVP